VADELKAILGKLLLSAGKKKLFFAYGTGKRKDGKGDGALLVRGKKPKKQDVEAVCDCSQFTEGTCWSATEGQTIYLHGRKDKLAASLVTKMALSAKHETGKIYDFQVPSDEEAARVAHLVEGEEETAVPHQQAVEAHPAAPPSGVPGLKDWQSARTVVVNQIRAVANAVAQTKDPDAAPVLIALNSIVKQLTESPTLPQQVAELEKYLRDDDVITAAEEVPPQYGSLRIRAPLLQALGKLKV
jgi:hypothetical protein